MNDVAANVSANIANLLRTEQWFHINYFVAVYLVVVYSYDRVLGLYFPFQSIVQFMSHLSRSNVYYNEECLLESFHDMHFVHYILCA